MIKERLTEEEIYEQKRKDVLEGGEILKVKDDRTFKLMFNNGQEEFLKWFMSNLLERNVDRVYVENNELAPLNIYDKKKMVDCIVEIGNELIIVELNNNNSGIDYTRNLLYTFHALLNKVKKGGKYHEMHGYLVNLNLFTKDNKYYDMQGLTEITYPYPKIGFENIKNIITIKNVNLSFYSNVRYNGIKMKDFLWKLFTIDKLDELHDVKENISELKRYCNEIERLSHDKEYVMEMWDEQIEKNLQEMALYGRGYDEGVEKAQKEMIINMYNDNVSIDVIAKYSNLTMEEVQEIIYKNKE